MAGGHGGRLLGLKPLICKALLSRIDIIIILPIIHLQWQEISTLRACHGRKGINVPLLMVQLPGDLRIQNRMEKQYIEN